MGERNTISSSFTVNTIEDGKDGMVYEIVSSVGSVTIPSDASTATLSATLSFYRRQGTGARETYSCYYAVFRKKGSTYSLIQRSTSKVNSANISFEVTEGNTDAIVACMYDQLATEHSGYLAELEIPVRKNGDTGQNGVDGAGSEWVYIRSTTNTPPVLLNDANYSDSHQPPRDYDEDDFLPRVDTSQRTDIEGWDNPNFPGECSDDPKGVSELWPFEWKAKRTKLLNQAGTAREWQKYYDATGNTHTMSLDSNWSKDGKDAASLVFEPAVIVLHADSNGNVFVGQSVYSTVTMMLPNGTTTTQITLLSEDLYGDAKGSVSGRTIEVWTDEELLDEDAEGYYVVSYSATINGVTYVAKGSLKITVARDGADGPRGNTGPMSYLAGEYDATVNYGNLLTDTTCPVVLYTDGYYWYPTEDYRGTGYPPSVANGWQKADNFEMVVTKILFTQFAKLGGFVVSGDYMLSHYGELIDANGNKLTLTEVTDDNGFRSWQYNGVDAYTYFRDYDPMVEYGVLPSIQTRQGVNWQYWNYYETTSDEFYMPVQATEGNAANTSKLVSLSAGDHYYIYGKDQSGVQHCIMVRVTRYDSANRRLYGYREKSLGRYVPVLYSTTARMFRPAKVVNAVTSEEWMAGGKVHVSADGDVTVEGTILAKNLYRNVCTFVDGGTYFNRNGERWFYNPTTGGYEKNPETTSGKVQCIYDADIVFMLGRGASGWQNDDPVFMPRAAAFQGKIIEFIIKCDTSGAGTIYIGAVGSSNSMGSNEIAMLTSAVPTGDKYNLYPIQTSNNCFVAAPDTRVRFISMPDSYGVWKWVVIDETNI